ncbi:MAG: type II secretion system ATPase GspE [Spirochaetia bacterium]|nr:type II secretion system ATPase GspE [Spirochaetia bacterium]
MRDLVEILIHKKLVDEDEINKAREIEKKSGINIGQILLKKGLLHENDLLDCISEQYDIPSILKLEIHNIHSIVSKVPLKFIQKYRIIPFYVEDDLVKIAVFDPTQLHPIDEIRLMFADYQVEIYLALESEILKIIHNVFENQNDSKLATGITTEEGLEFLTELDDLRDSMDLANEAPIIKMVNLILSNAISDRASDIHIEPQEKELWVRYRVDGVLHKVLSPPKAIQNGILSRIKIMANLNIAENRLPQDGKIKIRFGGNDIDIRVSSLPTQFGERLVLRLLNKSEYDFNIENIGFEKNILDTYKKVIDEPNGIILITGPTGSGKTTTLYASLQKINDESRNIITVEDPVEYQINGISQVHARPKIGLSFAEGLRSILRQDPDVIMVGEIRDEETARVAIQSALTGHMVLSTLHTNDAPSSISRLLDMGIEPYLITATVRGVMAQRLLRVLCQKCRVKVKANAAHLKEISKYMEKPVSRKSKTKVEAIQIYEVGGCKECMNTGYKGRIGIYELMIIDEKMRSVILKNPSLDDVRNLAIKNGMKTLRESAILKVLSGITTMSEALRIT